MIGGYCSRNSVEIHSLNMMRKIKMRSDFMPKTRELGKEKKMDAQMRDDLMCGEVEKWIRVSRIPKP